MKKDHNSSRLKNTSSDAAPATDLKEANMLGPDRLRYTDRLPDTGDEPDDDVFIGDCPAGY